MIKILFLISVMSLFFNYSSAGGPHGFEHKSHQKWAEWKESLNKTRNKIIEIFPDQPVPFRPPYGQRSLELTKYQSGELKASVMLWNIDSQDWHSKIDASQVGDRVQKLMLLWRKGIILFHDVHPKALIAMMSLTSFADKAGLHWVNCHDIKVL